MNPLIQVAAFAVLVFSVPLARRTMAAKRSQNTWEVILSFSPGRIGPTIIALIMMATNGYQLSVANYRTLSICIRDRPEPFETLSRPDAH